MDLIQWAESKGIDLKDALRQYLSKGARSIEETAEFLNCSPVEVVSALKELSFENILVDEKAGMIKLATELEPVYTPHKIDMSKYKEVEYPIGVVSDNHIGNRYERMDVLEALYDKFKMEGITKVYQAGNIMEAEARFNKFDLYVYGVEELVKNLVDKWPERKGIVTEFITGDDHEGWLIQREHLDIGKKIQRDFEESGRFDLKYLGHMERDLEFKQAGGSNIIRLIHGGGGATYALSYVLQKLIESLSGGEKPNVLLCGHHHKFNYAYVRNVHAVLCGTTCDQTPWMRKRKIEAHVGGLILWIKQNELGIFTSVKVQWMPFYDKKFYEYKW